MEDIPEPEDIGELLSTILPTLPDNPEELTSADDVAQADLPEPPSSTETGGTSEDQEEQEEEVQPEQAPTSALQDEGETEVDEGGKADAEEETRVGCNDEPLEVAPL